MQNAAGSASAAGVVPASALGKRVPPIKATGDLTADYLAGQQREALVQVIDLLIARPQHRTSTRDFVCGLAEQEKKSGLSAMGDTFHPVPGTMAAVLAVTHVVSCLL